MFTLKIVFTLSVTIGITTISNAQLKGTFTDTRDGNTYHWVQIGEQVWMSENLAYKPSKGNWWLYNNNPFYTGKVGYLYDWQTAMVACPPGWHLPADREWAELENYLGGSHIAGTRLKATSGWSNNGNGTNDAGFSALPGGMRKQFGEFSYMGITGRWWSATPLRDERAVYRRLYFYKSSVRDSERMQSAMSVRCIKDHD